MKKNLALLPMMAGFFVMGFSDIIGTVMNQVKAECKLSDVTAGFLTSMIFIWFFLISIPTGVLCGKIGRKNTVLVSLGITVLAMLLPLAANAERFWIYFVSFALLGIGNTIIQAALPALMSNVVPPDQLTSRISLGQFVKAICAALTPVFVYLTATALGNWKLLFPLYGALTVVAAVWLWLTGIPDERGGTRSGASAMESQRDKFIDEHRALFWYTPEEEKRGVSDELLVETILNDGTLDDFRELKRILTPKRLAQVFFSAVGRKAGNYYPEIRNFFSLALKQYA